MGELSPVDKCYNIGWQSPRLRLYIISQLRYLMLNNETPAPLSVYIFKGHSKQVTSGFDNCCFALEFPQNIKPWQLLFLTRFKIITHPMF